MLELLWRDHQLALVIVTHDKVLGKPALLRACGDSQREPLISEPQLRGVNLLAHVAHQEAHTGATPDLALGLPTGRGKTLPGLVIADWVRRTRPARVAYACPTVQLARQVAETASREGVSAVVLVRSLREWPVAGEARYEAAEAVPIMTYSTVFTSSP